MKPSISLISIIFILLFVTGSANYADNNKTNNEEEKTQNHYPQSEDVPEEDLPITEEEDNSGLSSSYYHKTCPDAEAIIFNKMDQLSKTDPTLLPSVLRLFFHDCVVRVRHIYQSNHVTE